MIDTHPQARELLQLMAELSARHYAGDWGEDFEYLLYEALSVGPIQINGHWIDRIDIDRVRLLSERVDGWWTRQNGEFVFLDLYVWHTQFVQDGLSP